MPQGSIARDSSVERFELSLVNRQSDHVVDEQRLLEAARRVLTDADFRTATVSLAVVDDATIHALNRRHLDHDWPTDVLSFVLESGDDHLEGEVVLSADTAAASAAEGGWSAAEEQLLYVVHGMLHLVGHDDASPAASRAMREAETRYLCACGIEPSRAERIVRYQCIEAGDARGTGGLATP